jgi:hypothetical protein
VQLGIGIGIGHAALVGGGGAAAPFVPTDITGNIMWLDSTLGITLGGTMRAAGTAPPVVTLTGTLTQATSILLDMPVGGARGTAQFRWSFDAGATWSAQTLTAATVAIGATGATANFPVGTYNTDNTYKTTVATWADQNAATNNVTQATAASQPLYVYSSTFGCNVVESSGSLRLVKTTGGLTGDASHSIWARVRLTATSSAGFGFHSVAATGSPLAISHIGCGATNTMNYGTGTTATPTGSALVNGTVYTVGKTHTLGGNDQGYLNGATDGSALGRTYTLGAGFCIASRANTASVAAPAQHRKVLMYSAVPTAGEIASITTWMAT